MWMGETEAKALRYDQSRFSIICHNIERLQARSVLEQMRKIVLCVPMILFFLCN